MGLGAWLRPRFLDLAMRQMDDLRPETVGLAEGEVLEIGFGTGLNLAHYGPGVKSLVALEPNQPVRFPKLDARLAAAPFPVERAALRADATLPFDAGRFDCVVSTWTMCSIPDLPSALSELRRVLKPGGRFVFVEHGRADAPRTARWQDRLDPLWVRISDGCHMNRAVDHSVESAGFALVALDRFRNKGPAVLAHMFRGVAERAA
jgi:SAM-dependent methyltransferase